MKIEIQGDFPLNEICGWIDEGLFGQPNYSITSFLKRDDDISNI